MKNSIPRASGQARFRTATLADIPAMSAIRLSVTENVLADPSRISQQMYRDYLELYGRGWVAELDGVIAGFSYADQRDGSIWALFVVPACEGRGLGQALLDLAVAWLFDQGHDKVQLSTGKDTRADRFYAAQGWTRHATSERDAYYQLAR